MSGAARGKFNLAEKVLYAWSKFGSVRGVGGTIERGRRERRRGRTKSAVAAALAQSPSFAAILELSLQGISIRLFPGCENAASK